MLLHRWQNYFVLFTQRVAQIYGNEDAAAIAIVMLSKVGSMFSQAKSTFILLQEYFRM